MVAEQAGVGLCLKDRNKEKEKEVRQWIKAFFLGIGMILGFIALIVGVIGGMLFLEWKGLDWLKANPAFLKPVVSFISSDWFFYFEIGALVLVLGTMIVIIVGNATVAAKEWLDKK